MRALHDMRGRALLADEVGLGKTIEAGIVMKELIRRGLVRTVLVLTPASLTEQWREELEIQVSRVVHRHEQAPGLARHSPSGRGPLARQPGSGQAQGAQRARSWRATTIC